MPWLSYLKLVLVTLFWGGTFIAGKVTAKSLDPYLAATGRFWFASVFLGVMLYARQREPLHLTRRQIVLLAAGALTGIIAYNLFFFNGLKHIPANRASLIVALNPIVIMLAAATLRLERLTRRRAAGIVIALFGAVYVLTHGHLTALGGSIGRGELIIGGCVLSWSTYTLIGRSLLKTLTPLAATTYACILGALGLTVASVLHGAPVPGVSLKVWASVAYLGISARGWVSCGIMTACARSGQPAPESSSISCLSGPSR